MINKRNAFWYINYFLWIITVVVAYQECYKVMCSSGPIYQWGPFAVQLTAGAALGFLLGFDHLRNETYKDGKWQFDYPKALIIGIPTFVFIMASPIGFLSGIKMPEILTNTETVKVITAACVFFICRSFTKAVNEDKKDDEDTDEYDESF